MTTTLNRDSIKVKRDLQKRVENWVAEYCDALEENFKQYSINSYKRNIDKPTEVSKGYTSYYEEQLQKIEFRLLYSNYNRKSNKKEPFVSKSTQLIS